MRTTLNLSEKIIIEVERFYDLGSRSKAVERALEDAVRFKKLRTFMDLKGRVAIDEEQVRNIREAELGEIQNHC